MLLAGSECPLALVTPVKAIMVEVGFINRNQSFLRIRVCTSF